MEYKFVCVAKCPELDSCNEQHCRCFNVDSMDEKFFPDGCPCGNTPKWEKINTTNKKNILAEYISEIFKKYHFYYFDGDGKTPVSPDELIISYGEKPMDLRIPVNLFAEELFDKILNGVCNVKENNND